MRSGAGGPSKGRIRIDPETQEVELDVRQLLARLSDLRRGLTAAKPITPADKQPLFDTLIASIGTAIAAAESPDSVDLKVAEGVVTMANEIRSAITPGAAPIKTEDAAGVF
jgi:hypothetical protein